MLDSDSVHFFLLYHVIIRSRLMNVRIDKKKKKYGRDKKTTFKVLNFGLVRSGIDSRASDTESDVISISSEIYPREIFE